MLGAIIGDIVGSRFEFDEKPTEGFELFTEDCDFTDDTICTVAIADAILNERPYKETLVEWCQRYPNPKGGYGNMFLHWLGERNHLRRCASAPWDGSSTTMKSCNGKPSRVLR